MSPHLSDDELIRLLYGVGEAEGHLDACLECGERWAEMHRALGRTRAETSAAAEINGRKLAVQRQEILDRLAQPSSGLQAWRWVPPVAAASLLAAAIVIYGPSSILRPPSTAPAAVNTDADSELFTDVYSMERDVEPRAAAPIRALFISDLKSDVKSEETSFEPSAAEESKKQ